jgi:hypothetical protein
LRPGLSNPVFFPAADLPIVTGLVTLRRNLTGAIILTALCAAFAVVMHSGWLVSGSHTGLVFPWNTDAAPAADARAWQWVAAAPGVNIYVAPRGARDGDQLVSAWVKRELYRNLAGIDKSFIELRQFDCPRDMSRTQPDHAHQHATVSDGSWTIARPGTPDERVLLTVCGQLKPRSARPMITEQSAWRASLLGSAHAGMTAAV